MFEFVNESDQDKIKKLTPAVSVVNGAICLYIRDENSSYLILSINRDGKLHRFAVPERLDIPTDNFGSLNLNN